MYIEFVINRITNAKNKVSKLQTSTIGLNRIEDFVNNCGLPSLRSKITEEVVNIEVFPNPTSGILNISHPESVEQLTISNIEGKVLAAFRNMDLKEGQIDVSHLSTGTYLVAISIRAGRILHKKIIIIK